VQAEGLPVHLRSLLVIGATAATLSVLSLLAVSAMLAPCAKAADAPVLKELGRVKYAPLREPSGLVKSRRHRGIFWTINDSESGPHLFALDRTATVRADFRVKGAVNIDWEALAMDEAGNLYVGDVGNNLAPRGLPRRWVYRLPEPDRLELPTTDRTPEVPAERTYPFRYAARSFDCEGMFWHADSLFLISKVSKNTAIHRLPLDRPGEVTTLEEVIVLTDVPLVTDASLSEDGKRLAVCSYDYAAVFTLDPKQPLDQLKDSRPTVVRFPSTSIEGCCWDGDELLLIAEDGRLYALRP
jgi:hypothetical protein